MGYWRQMRKGKKSNLANNLLKVISHPGQSTYISGMIKQFLSFCLLVLATVSASQAQSSPAIPDGVIKLTVLPGWRTPGGSHMAGLRIQLKPGWKTYWRAPGDAGIPPRFDWRGSKNIGHVKFHWPRPSVDYSTGMRTIVYKNQVVIPIEFSPRHKGKSLNVKGRVDLGVCKDICIPVSLDFSSTLPASATKPDPAIRNALKSRPILARNAGVKSVSCSIEPISDGLRLTATIKMPSTGKGEIVVVEMSDQNIWVAEASSKRSGQTLTATTELVSPSNAPFMLERSKIRFTVIGSKSAVDIQGCTG